MSKVLITHIVSDFKSLGKEVLLVSNPDKFLCREDVVKVLDNFDVAIHFGSKIEQRIAYELRNPDKMLVLINDSHTDYLEDIKKQAAVIEFHLSDYLGDYHLPSILSCNLDILHQLFNIDHIFPLSKQETENLLKTLQPKSSVANPAIDLEAFKASIASYLSTPHKNWFAIIQLISTALEATINTTYQSDVDAVIKDVNHSFQIDLKEKFPQLINSSPIKKPKVVSKILDHLSFHYLEKKVALIVVDGMAFWQYQMLKQVFPEKIKIKEEVIYSWLPSITQLSRQAIFKGAVPDSSYTQNPKNEEKLWKSYWNSKGVGNYAIWYNHEKIDFSGLERITKFALVFKDLDEKMHSSTDYTDLKSLTKNWIERSKISEAISTLAAKGFQIFLTTDHGNIQAKGWRGLKGNEKLGTNQSGSRSQRHLEYSDQWIANQFMEANPDLYGSIVQDKHLIYFTGNLSFSRANSLITHGGSHILEVLIPFIKIVNE